MNGDYSYSPLSKMNLNMLEPLAENALLDDGTMEPLSRARSNTWPLPRPENFVDPPEDGSTVNGVPGNKCPVPIPVVPTKKNSSRRNAWGNLSYADLITQAITTSPDKRLTLSQIYEWMVTNVPYFKDKGDSNSSAGWKNSIRHNLSLHNRFMRVQNEGTGKSSWWMINPDAKPGKSVRRRAASMETSKFEKRRGRVKKKVEMMRNGALPDTTPSPSSSVSESLDLFPESPGMHSGFQLSPEFRPRANSNPTTSFLSGGGFQLSPDIRPRTSSNASARLSPIPSLVGNDADWGSPFGSFGAQEPMVNGSTGGNGSYSPDQLAGNLQTNMKLENDAYMGYLNGTNQPPPSYNSIFNDQFSPAANRDYTTLNKFDNSANYTCSIHRMCPCTCIKLERMSPSPTYSNPENPPDLTPQFMSRMPVRPPSSSPPLTPQSQGIPSTMMGQAIGALNSDDLNALSVDTFQGGFDCNVEEIIKNELNMEGSLDFNFTAAQQQYQQNIQNMAAAQQAQHEASLGVVTQATGAQAPPPYSQAAVTTPSWVH